MKKLKRGYLVALFILLVLIAYGTIYRLGTQAVDMILLEKTNLMFLEYKTIYHNNKNIADLIFETEINRPEVIALFKNKKREQLHQYLSNNYQKFKRVNVKQLHFHLPNNDSFLRMHRPTKFGDNLTTIRATVKYVNEYKKPIDGFEEGRIYNGFRFVYPLSYANKHIGSVEISFSALSFIKEIVDNYKVESNFLINKSVVNKKVFEDEHSNYLQSPMPQYYFQKSILDYTKFDTSKRGFSKKEIGTIYQRVQLGEAFSKYDAEYKQIVTFVPLKNPITKKVVALFTFRNDDTLVANENYKMRILFVIATIIIGLILLLIYKELQNREKMYERTQELLRLNKKLEEMAYIDSLTEIYNRRYLYEVAKRLIPIVKREKQALSVAMLDLDKFKEVNDTYGHDIGDEVLKAFADDIKNSIRESDIFIRFGGEEFVLVLPNTDLEHAQVLIEKLRKIIEDCDKVEGVRFTVSIGVAAFDVLKDDLDSIIKKADEALYEAKNSGRNRVVCKY